MVSNVNLQKGLPPIGRTLLLLLVLLMGSAAQVPVRNGRQNASAILPGNSLAADEVTVTGTLVSADTGEPIAGGHIIILNPGISPTGYAEDPSNPAAVVADGESDLNGHFQAAPPVFSERSYGVIVVARGYLGKVAGNRRFAGPDDPDVVDLGEIRMQSAT